MAVKKYSLKKDGEKFCSEHTRVREMRCKDGTDKILIDEKLMEMIEKLFETLNCKKYIITSGYRTPSYDKKVGGNGKGQHTKGTAVDCYFYDKNGKVISSKEVSCVAQDLGFKGIANINNKYEAIHLDMRTSGKYYGNEVYGTKNVTDDFYKYYEIDRHSLRKKYGLPVDETGKKKSNYEIAVEVINGKWGNGSTRKNKLKKAGYDYKVVQQIVNDLLL